MAKYRVTWVIDVEADSPEGAAWKARECQDKDTTALEFQVVGPDNKTHTVDLTPLNWYQVRLPVSIENIHFKNFKPNPGAPYPSGVTCRYLVHDRRVHCASIESFWEAEPLDYGFTWEGVEVTDEHREAWNNEDDQLKTGGMGTEYHGRDGKDTPKETWPHAHDMGTFEHDDKDPDGRAGYQNALEYSQGNHMV